MKPVGVTAGVTWNDRTMQVFVPISTSLEANAAVLDNRRLNKQLLKAVQILRTIQGITSGWRNHPAVIAWRYHPAALANYAEAVAEELRQRGIRCEKSAAMLAEGNPGDPIILPPWFGDEAVHASHRARLLQKDPAHYGQFGWTEDPDGAEYWWPIWTDEGGVYRLERRGKR
jgi:hypothetical protein